jgi:hypothetical protein
MSQLGSLVKKELNVSRNGIKNSKPNESLHKEKNIFD